MVVVVDKRDARARYEQAVERLMSHRVELEQSAHSIEAHFSEIKTDVHDLYTEVKSDVQELFTEVKSDFQELPSRTIGENPYAWLAGAFALGFAIGWR